MNNDGREEDVLLEQCGYVRSDRLHLKAGTNMIATAYVAREPIAPILEYD